MDTSDLPDSILEALSLQGYMKKKSPSKLKGWQKRYFILCRTEDTFSLAYFISQDEKKPQGSIDIGSIINVDNVEDRLFNINYPQREFNFKVKSEEERDKWVSSIKVLMEYTKNNKKPKKEQPRGSVTNIPNLLKRKGSSNAEKIWKQFTDQTISSISYDKEQKLADSSISNNQSQVTVGSLNGDQLKSQKRGSIIHSYKKDSLTSSENDSPFKNNSQVENQKLFKLQSIKEMTPDYVYEKLGVQEYLKDFPQDFIENRVLYGFINKRSKSKIKYFQKRFFLLVSTKSLNNIYCDEDILQEKDLPTWLELDTLYYYKIQSKEDIGKPKGHIAMQDCLEIIEKDMTTSKEEGFTFKINCGDRIFHLMTETSTERKKWVSALRTSIITAKEFKGAIQVKKNIDKIIKSYDYKDYDGQSYGLMDKRKHLREKIDEDIEKIRDQYYNSNKNAFLNFCEYLKKMSQELLNILEACMAKEIKRTDIVKEYIDYFHSEVIANDLTKYWDENHNNLSSVELLQLANWLSGYSELLKKFFEDERLKQAARLLIKTYRMQTLKGGKELVQNIIDYEKKETNIQSDGSGKLTSTTPFDLYKIISTAFDLALNVCSIKDMGVCMAQYGKAIVEHYQNLLSELQEDYDLQIQQEICFCNNIIEFVNQTQQYNDRLQSEGQLTSEECDKYFMESLIKQKFIQISNDSHCLVFNKLFANLSQFFEKKYFLDLDMETILTEVLKQAIPNLRLLHDRFSRKVWKELLECITLFFFQCMILSCPKSKKDHQETFIEKIDEDYDFLYDSFSENIFEKSLNEILKPFSLMKEFLQSSDLQVQQPCKGLREYFGRQFTQKTVKILMNIRHDLDRTEKNEMIESCVMTIDAYNKENENEKENPLYMNRKRQQSSLFSKELGEEAEEKPANSQIQQPGEVFRQNSMRLSDDEDNGMDFPDDPIQNRKTSVISQKGSEQFFVEGWMEKRNEKKKTFQRRFFRIRDGQLFWYVSDRAQYCQKKLPLSNVGDEILAVEEKKTFSIVYESKKGKVKHYKFKCQNTEERDLWVKSFRNQLNIIKKQQSGSTDTIEIMNLGEGLQPLFKDYYEIKRQEEILEAKRLREQKLLELQEYEKQKEEQNKSQTKNHQMQTFDISINESSSNIRSLKGKRTTMTMKSQINMERESSIRMSNYGNQQQEEVSCCDQLMMFLGLKKQKKQERFSTDLSIQLSNMTEASLTEKFEV